MKRTAYIDRDIALDATGSGTLDGLTFAVKDVMDIKGHVATIGNPLWRDSHLDQPAQFNAPVIDRLLAAGANLRGTTITDEFMYSINGKNIHYGTPLNPLRPDSYTGGSSCGSASAVAQGLCDFALATDAGGSSRVPAAYCGIYGFRPTYNPQLLTGVAKQAKSFETVGLFTRDIDTLLKVAPVIYDGSCAEYTTELSMDSVLFYEDSFNLLPENIKNTIYEFLVDGLPLPNLKVFSLIPGLTIKLLYEAFKRIQGIEMYEEYGSWLEAHKDVVIEPEIRNRFEWASTLTKGDLYHDALDMKESWTKYVCAALEKGLIILPTTISEAPQIGSTSIEIEEIRAHTMELTCLASLAGLPQINIPVLTGGRVLGLSLIGPRGSGIALIEFVKKYFNA
ncbi:MAG: hypothetical protein LBN22_11160 [Clostridiales Family XIII bacterium]|jgi:amidase|nr:hypothetical protein [Clostridiales Family XIII bacterium]